MININISGAKNDALPILAATLIEKNIYYISNIPLILDVEIQLDILKQFNVKINYINQNNLIIDTTQLIIPNIIDYTKNTRGTYYFIGSTVTYDIDLEYILDTGCKIDERNIDYHIELLKLLGKDIKKDNNKLLITGKCKNDNLNYTFIKPSIGATINALFMYSKCKSEIILNNYAKDPYIIDTIFFLRKIGINIDYNDRSIILNGNNNSLLSKTIINHSIIDDPIEALTYIIYSGINLNDYETSTYTIGPITKNNLGENYNLLELSGIILIESNIKNYYYVKRTKLKAFNIKTDYYPKIYTDIQPFLTLLALHIENSICTITEQIWNNRFKYIYEINKLGYNIKINENKIIVDTSNNNEFQDLSIVKVLTKEQIITNKMNESNNIIKNIECTDLRGGMALLLLMRKNKIMDDPINKYYIDRGYYNYENNINIILENNKNLYYNYSIKNLSNIKIGNISKYYIEVFTEECIINIINYCKKNNIKYKLIGDGNNIYFSEYYDGMIIKNKYKNIFYNKSDDYFIVSSGISLIEFILYVTEYGYDLSNLAGIPGTIGGAIYGNAGAYDMEICNIIESCKILTNENTIINILNKNIDFEYRFSKFKKDNNDIIISSIIKIKKSNLSIINIKIKISEIIFKRNIRIPMQNTLGSVFKNVIKDNNKIYIWKLIDELNLRGITKNNITINYDHPNIFINNNNASPNDLNNLILEISDLIFKKYNIKIEKEIEYIC